MTSDPTAAADTPPDPTLVIPVRARLAAAEAALDALRTLPPGDTPVIDASQVEDISTQYVGVLHSALAARSAASPPLVVLAPTPAFVDAFSDLGLFADLMKMEFRQ
ncbi:MAG: STAS domain-containing protein [Pseudomonadota bacterium]